MNYEYVEYVLATYLASGVGLSEDEAIDALRAHIESNPEFGAKFRADLRQALSDNAYSWTSVLENFDVLTETDENTARSYVKAILWDSLFPT